MNRSFQQAFGTNLYGRDLDLELEIVMLPRSESVRGRMFEAQELLNNLDTTAFAYVQASQVEALLPAFLTVASHGPTETEEWIHQGATSAPWRLGISPSLTQFAFDLLNDAEIPIKESPLDGQTLQMLLQKASTVSVGTAMGFAVAGATPLLFLTVPAGIILIGIATGIAEGTKEGLKEGLKERIKKFFTGK